MENLKEKFFEVMNNDACDLMELIFVSEKEKENYINEAWEKCQDEIECYIEGEIGEFDEEDFESKLMDAFNADKEDAENLDDYYAGIVLSAIYENRELIFE